MLIDFSNPELYNEKYIPLLHDKKRYLWLVGSAGSGKSVFVAQKKIIESFKPKRKTLCVRKVKDTLKESCFAELESVINEWKLNKYFNITTSPMSIKNIQSGSSFIFRGLDDPEKIKSVQGVTDGWGEEATEFTSKDVDQLDLRIRGKKDMQWVFTLNPIHEKHWIKVNVFDKGENENVTLLHTTYRDNRFVGEEYGVTMERLRETNPVYYRIYALGLWGSDPEGLVFPSIQETDGIPLAADFLGYGLDFGYSNDPTSLVSIYTEPRKEGKDILYIKEHVYEKGLLTSDLADRMETLGIDKSVKIFADCSAPDKIEELRKRGFNIHPCKKGSGSILYGIDRIREYNVHVDEYSVNVVKEFSLYSWKKNKKQDVYTNEPVDANNHAIDAIRYALTGLVLIKPKEAPRAPRRQTNSRRFSLIN